VATFRVGQRIRIRGKPEIGTVILVVPPMRNPLKLIAVAFGHLDNVCLRGPERDFMPLREKESYVIRMPYKKRFVRHTWPHVSRLEAVE